MTLWFNEFMQAMQNGVFDFFFNFVSFLGEDYVFILVLGFIYWTYDKELGEIMALALAISVVANNFLKELFDAQRPFEKYPDVIINKRPDTATGASFPSGHTQNFTAFLFAYFYKNNSRKILIPAIILSILMALSRVYLGVHFLEDVVFAILFGILIAYIIHFIYESIYPDVEILDRVFLSILVVFSILLILMNSEDYYKGYGILAGFILAIKYERKNVKFTFEVSKLKKFYRLSLGLAIMLVIQIGLKELFNLTFGKDFTYINMLHLLRYFLIAFVGFGLYPQLFKKYNF